MSNATTLFIKSLTIVNFKGIKNRSISFNDFITNIFGDNATGKTTISDAVHWLFFGKDSQDRKDFDIKNTVDLSLNRQDHEVEAIVNFNGSDIKLKRIFREKWTKPKGAEVASHTGHETKFYWDDAPIPQGDYNKKISELIDEKIFKLITNPGYFNSLKWQDRRMILFDIAGNVTNKEVAGDNPKFLEILAQLTNGKTLEEFKRQIALQRKKKKEDLEQVPTRIDEVNKGIPEMADASLIRRQVDEKNAKITFLDTQISDRSNSMNTAYEAIRKHQEKIFLVKTEMTKIENTYKQQLESAASDIEGERKQITAEIRSKEAELDQIEGQNKLRQSELETINQKIIEKRALWNSVNTARQAAAAEQLVFDDHFDTCPTCKRLFSDDDIAAKKDELLDNFNKSKAEKVASYAKELEQIVVQANLLKAEKERLESLDNSADIANVKQVGLDLCAKLEEFEKSFGGPSLTIEEHLADNSEYQELIGELNFLESNTPSEPVVDITDQQNEKAELEKEVRDLERELAKEDIIKQAKERIKILEADEKRLAGELAALEGQEFTIEAFTRKKIDMVEAKINGLFQHVTFKMFDSQINGGEVETCETMLGGVPWSVLNTAGRINAGLDIINTLSKYYKVHAPVFIDNAESITKFIDVESQAVRLVVSETDKNLRVA
ncbi:AAA family ATPase [Sphingobacterium multivorum]|uniref:AAA family ATPase n=1 Tax=Sphingobacterium multivorum TaxID=28454 RepID=UPI0028A95279|nr:AAA family ATPase [Sphingobacterium multivorum]